MAEVVKLRQEQQNTKSNLEAMEDRLQGTEQKQQQMMAFLARVMRNPEFLKQLTSQNEIRKDLQEAISKKRRRCIDQGPEVDDLGANCSCSLEQGSPLLFDPLESAEFLDDIPIDIRNSALDAEVLIEPHGIDLGTSEQQQNVPQELNKDFWEELLNEGLSEENDNPVRG